MAPSRPRQPEQPLATERAESARPMSWPGWRRVLQVLGRAARLKCPHCGKGPVIDHWFKMRARCATCGLAIERGERDYFIGSMLFNLVVAEMVFAIVFITTLVIAWPNVPWDTIQWAAPLGIGVAPFVLFPLSKLAWLGFDILLRPVTPEELLN